MKQLFTLGLLLFAFGTMAQSGVKIRVFDQQTDEKVYGATVTIDRDHKNVITLISDINGDAESHLPPGIYALTVSYVGYSIFRSDSVTVANDKYTYIDVPLSTGIQLEEVVVVQSKPTVKTRSLKSSVSLQAGISSCGSTPPNQPQQVRSNQAPPPLKTEVAATVAAPHAQLPAAGQLTAGHWRDIDNKDYWKDILSEDLANWKDHWEIYPDNVTEITLTNRAGLPLIDAEVTMYNQKDQTELWRTRTDNSGKATLWLHPFQDYKGKEAVRIEVQMNGKAYPLQLKAKEGKHDKTFRVNVACEVVPAIDVLFAIDVSGSMKDELRFLKSELIDVMSSIEKNHSNKVIRTASICYQSPGDAYITKWSDFTEDAEVTASFFSMQTAKGGKGGEEAVELAIQQALRMSWSDQAVARLLFILLDEPPAHDSERKKMLHQQTRLLAQKGIKLIPIISSGAKRDVEYLMRAMCVMTNGTYVFLTDHSGIGDAHLEPVTDSYEVFALNDLLVKIVNHFSNYNSCEEQTPEVEITNAIDEVNFGAKIYPNPVANFLTVTTTQAVQSIILYDAQGKTIYQFAEGETELDVTNLAAGNYFIEITGNNKQSMVKKVVVKRT